MKNFKSLLFMVLFGVIFCGYNTQILAQNKPTFKSLIKSKKSLPLNIPLENSLLWEITGRDLEKPSYIFGTIHKICSSDILWTAEFEQALNYADEIVFEVDYHYMVKYLGETIDQDILEKYYIDPDQTTEKKGLDKFRKKVLKNGTNNDQFKRFKNKVLHGSLLSFDDLQISSCAFPTSYEIQLIEKGLIKGKQFNFLETVEEQLEALYSDTDNYRTFRDKVKILYDDMSHEEKINKLITLYLQQNISGLYEFMINPVMGLVDLDALIYDRNIKWSIRIPEKLKEGKSLFIAIGAGHLGSELGIIHLLREQGYNVQPIQ